MIFLGFAAHMEECKGIPPIAANIAVIDNCAEMKAIWCTFHGLKFLTFRKINATLNRIDLVLLSKIRQKGHLLSFSSSIPFVILRDVALF